MNHRTTLRIGEAALLVLLGTALAQHGEAQSRSWQRIVPPDENIGVDPPDSASERCGETEDEQGSEDFRCRLVRAVADLEGPIPAMTLEGSFCANPEVFIGGAGGELNRTLIFAAAPDFIVVDLTGHADRASSVVLVECPCASCALDVTIGVIGPVGPTGPTGATGVTGATGPGLNVRAGVIAFSPALDLDEIPESQVVPFVPSFATVPSVTVSAVSSLATTARSVHPVPGNVTTSDWTLQFVRPGRVVFRPDSGAFVSGTSLEVVAGNPAMAYYESAFYDLKYVRATDESGTSWGVPIGVESAGVVGASPSLAVIDGNPAIAYHEGSYGGLRYVRATDAVGAVWDAPVGVAPGTDASLALVAGNPAIAYYGPSAGEVNYVRAAEASGTTWKMPVTVASFGARPSLAVVAGNPAISYWTYLGEGVQYVRATDTFGENWGTPISVGGGQTGPRKNSLAVVAGNPAVAYYEELSNDVKYVRATDAFGTSWGSAVSVDSHDFIGEHIQLAVIAGNPAIAYYGDHGLEYVRATDALGTNWGVPTRVDPAGGFPSLAEVDGKPAIGCGADGLKFVTTAPAASVTWIAVEP
jgi:hypothetical protein